MVSADHIIRYQAHFCLRRLGQQVLWSLEDLVSEGHICLARAEASWKKEGGAAFNTYLTCCLIRHYQKIIRKAHNRPEPLELVMEPQVDQTITYRDAQTGEVFIHVPHDVVSEDVQLFLDAVVHPPTDLKKVIQDHRSRRVVETIRGWLGWSRGKMRKVEKELVESIIV